MLFNTLGIQSSTFHTKIFLIEISSTMCFLVGSYLIHFTDPLSLLCVQFFNCLFLFIDMVRPIILIFPWIHKYFSSLEKRPRDLQVINNYPKVRQSRIIYGSRVSKTPRIQGGCMGWCLTIGMHGVTKKSITRTNGFAVGVDIQL